MIENQSSSLLNQDVSKSANEFVPIISIQCCCDSAGYRVPKSKRWQAESDSWVAGAAPVSVTCNDPDSSSAEKTCVVRKWATKGIEPFSIAVLLQGALRTSQHLPEITTQIGCTKRSISNERVKRVSGLVKGKKSSLTADPHSETDLGKICSPVSRKLGFLSVKTSHSACQV